MRKLSEIYKEMGIAFSFPIKIKDVNGNRTYYEDRIGYGSKREYDANGNQTYYENSDDSCYRSEYNTKGIETYFENSDGFKRGTPRSAKTCEGKVVEVDGVKYELKAL